MGSKYPDKLLDNLPPSAADFIKLVIKKMRYRKKVHAEVMAELAYHFEDELKDCKTEQEKKENAHKLIEEFGDPKLLAVLLRRAKKRCRPLWRTVVARSFQTAGVLVLCLVLYIVWFFTGKPNITINYFAQLNELVRPTVDESLNAAPYYRQAAELMEKKCGVSVKLRSKESDELSQEQRQSLDTEMNKLLGKKYEESTDQEKERVILWLQNNEEIFDFLAAGVQKPYYWTSYKEDGDLAALMKNVVPRFSTLKQLAMALRWRIGLSAAEGRCNDALEDVKTCYQLGQHLRGDGILIEQLVGIAIEALAIHSLIETLEDCPIDSSTLAAFQNEFTRMIEKEIFTVSLEAEKILIYDSIQRYFIDDPLGGHLYLKGLDGLITGQPSLIKSLEQRGISVLPHILFTHPDKQQTKEMFDEFYDFWKKYVHKNPAQLRSGDIDFSEEAERIIKGNLLLEIGIPALIRVSELSHRNSIGVKASLTILALLRYKAEEGTYPNNLSDLVDSGYLKQLPIDPYSDKPLVYKRTEDNFLLYSFGEDFDDDGGQYSRWGGGREGGDQVFWPLETAEQKEQRRKRERRGPVGVISQ
ncbi:MAG: hypothetical protein ACYSWP_12940 [Planctomycetota bacterium]|jgi:hypothetical protein